MDTKLLRQKILDLAIHGKLVSQDSNDEPASVLLERIRAEKEKLVQEGKIKKSKASATSDKHHYENPPFEIPESWEWCRLGEITEILSSKRIHKNDYIDSGIPFYRTTEIKELSENKAISRCLYIAKTQYDSIKDKFGVPNRGDILISAVGTIGITWIVENDNPFYFKDGNLIWIKQSQVLISNYLSWLLFHFVRVQNYILTSGSAYNALTIEKLAELIIPLPPLAEQKRIVAEIEKYFALIDEIEQNKTDLAEAITQTKSKILDLAIHGKLVPQDPNDEPAIKLLKRINPDFAPCDNEHYKNLPQGWAVCGLKELCNNVSGLWKGKKEPFVNVGVIRNANFTKDFKLDYSKIEYLDVEVKQFSTRSLYNGDLIVEKSGGSDNNPVGRAILYEGENGIYSFSNFTMALRVKNTSIISSKYLYYYILSVYLRGDMRTMQTQTTGLHNLILDKYLSMPILLPPLCEQQRIITTIETIFDKLNTIAENL